MIDRVVKVAELASKTGQCDFLVATDHHEIADHLTRIGVQSVMTSEELNSGSDRCLAAVDASDYDPDFIINLQGDVPFTPPQYIANLIESASKYDADVFTLGLNLSWEELDALREHKKSAPFSGTTCIRSQEGYALWFSKKILPAVRKETDLKKVSDLSPVIRHIGMYGYRTSALRNYVSKPPSYYEELEGLEQLRALEAGMSIYVSIVDRPKISMSGIDTAEDLVLAESSILKYGDPHTTGEYL